MTKEREALKLAFEALDRYQIKRQDFDTFADVITAIKEALAPTSTQCEVQPEQEPVATTYKEVTDAMNLLLNGDYKQVQMAQLMADAKLYTAPPKRPWVGLTDEQRNYCVETPFVSQQWANIEDKLRELNT